MGGILVQFAAAESQLLFFFLPFFLFLFLSLGVVQKKKKKSSDRGFVVLDVICRRLTDRPHIISGGCWAAGWRWQRQQQWHWRSRPASQSQCPHASLHCRCRRRRRRRLNASRCCLFIFMPHHLPCFILCVCSSDQAAAELFTSGAAAAKTLM